VTTTEILGLLKQATTDLLWSSESDYPFEIVTWSKEVEMTPIALFGDLPDVNRPIEMMSAIDFFEPVLTVEDWYQAEELAQVDRYTDLLHAIDSHLTDVKVYRLGEVEIAIYIVGKTPDGDIVGLKTYAVET
jgi:Nuclease A inhibitor-like protein